MYNYFVGYNMKIRQREEFLIMLKNGECIYERKNGHWEGVYCSGTDQNGKAFYRLVYGKNYYEVKKKLSLCEETKRLIKLPPKKAPLFREAVYLWKRTNANRYKGATALKYENMINNHILPILGGYKLSAFNTFLLSEFMYNKLKQGQIDGSGGLSPSYVRSIMLILLEIIEFAAEENMCAPIKIKIHKPPIEKRELEILDINSQKRLEKQLFSYPNETGIGILISLNTGLRIGEICALRWADIDLGNAIIHIRSTVARVKDESGNGKTKLIIDKPKTKSSLRDIPISIGLKNLLTLFYEKRKSDYVVSDKSGFLSPRTYEYRFHKVLEEHHIKSINYHALRHTFATRCVEQGVDVKALSEILGHSGVSTTLNTYVHSSMEHKRKQLEKLSAITM